MDLLPMRHVGRANPLGKGCRQWHDGKRQGSQQIDLAFSSVIAD